jgi:hypothetical protein
MVVINVFFKACFGTRLRLVSRLQWQVLRPENQRHSSGVVLVEGALQNIHTS